MQYAARTAGYVSAMGNETVAAPPPSQAAGFDAQPRGQRAANVPADFDVAGFLKGAKLNYMRLQIANDQGNLEELREFTSDELFEELKKDVRRARQREAADRRAGAERRPARSRHRGRQALGERALLGHRARIARRSAAGLRGGLEPRQAGQRPSGWQLAGIQQMH